MKLYGSGHQVLGPGELQGVIMLGWNKGLYSSNAPGPELVTAGKYMFLFDSFATSILISSDLLKCVLRRWQGMKVTKNEGKTKEMLGKV